MLDLGLWGKDAQTKCVHHCPRCGGDVYVLGLGVLMPQAMVGAKAMVVATNLNNFCARGVFEPGTIVRRIW